MIMENDILVNIIDIYYLIGKDLDIPLEFKLKLQSKFNEEYGYENADDNFSNYQYYESMDYEAFKEGLKEYVISRCETWNEDNNHLDIISLIRECLKVMVQNNYNEDFRTINDTSPRNIIYDNLLWHSPKDDDNYLVLTDFLTKLDSLKLRQEKIGRKISPIILTFLLSCHILDNTRVNVDKYFDKFYILGNLVF
jgi:hypothetical protein